MVRHGGVPCWERQVWITLKVTKVGTAEIGVHSPTGTERTWGEGKFLYRCFKFSLLGGSLVNVRTHTTVHLWGSEGNSQN